MMGIRNAYAIALLCKDDSNTEGYADYATKMLGSREEAEAVIKDFIKEELEILGEGYYSESRKVIREEDKLVVTEYSIVELIQPNETVEQFIDRKGYSRFLTELFMYEKGMPREKAEERFNEFMDNCRYSSYLNEDLFEEWDNRQEDEN